MSIIEVQSPTEGTFWIPTKAIQAVYARKRDDDGPGSGVGVVAIGDTPWLIETDEPVGQLVDRLKAAGWGATPDQALRHILAYCAIASCTLDEMRALLQAGCCTPPINPGPVEPWPPATPAADTPTDADTGARTR